MAGPQLGALTRPAMPLAGSREVVSSVLRSSSPLPCHACGTPRSSSALSMSICLTWSGVSCGYFWRSNATAPVTKAVASEVPLPRK